MTRAEFKEARRNLGLSTNGLAKLFHVSSGRTVRRWESGERSIPGPVLVLMRLITTSEECLRAVTEGKGKCGLK